MSPSLLDTNDWVLPTAAKQSRKHNIKNTWKFVNTCTQISLEKRNSYDLLRALENV